MILEYSKNRFTKLENACRFLFLNKKFKKRNLISNKINWLVIAKSNSSLIILT